MQNPLDIITAASIIGIMAAAVCTDVRSRKIPNRLTFSAMVFMLVYFSTAHGLEGLLFSAKGLLLGTGLLLPVYLAGGMGAGDAKLMGVAGAALGAQGVFTAFIFTALAGGMYAIGMVLFRYENSRGVLARMGLMLRSFVSTRRFVYIPEKKPEHGPKLCYAIPIAIGTAGALFWNLAYQGYLI